jgi:hypothetical protein
MLWIVEVCPSLPSEGTLEGIDSWSSGSCSVFLARLGRFGFKKSSSPALNDCGCSSEFALSAGGSNHRKRLYALRPGPVSPGSEPCWK